MAATSRATLKTFFLRGLFPTASQFATFIDSCFNLTDDKINIANVQGLPAALAACAPIAVANAALAAAEAALEGVQRNTVSFANQQVFNLAASDYPNLSKPLAAIFWAVMDEQPGYVEGDSSTWVFKQVSAGYTFTQDAGGNAVFYTFDLGYAPLHGKYQLY
jgi:hypothetical protein